MVGGGIQRIIEEEISAQKMRKKKRRQAPLSSRPSPLLPVRAQGRIVTSSGTRRLLKGLANERKGLLQIKN